MMKWWWRLAKFTNYESYVRKSSEIYPDVSFTIRRMSLDRRIELTRSLGDLLRRVEFMQSGKEPQENLEAAQLATELEKAYLLWGLVEIEGLLIDGKEATAERLASEGPEDLAREITAAIKKEAGLSESERKN